MVETSGKVKVATGLTTQGQGHQTVFAQIVADELGVPIARRRGRHRRHPALRLRGRHVRVPAAVMSGSAVALAARPAQAKALQGRRRGARGRGRRPGDRRRRGAESRATPTVGIASAPSRCCPTRCATRSTRRPRRRRSSPAATSDKPPIAEGDEPGIEGREFFSPVRSTFASGMHAVDRRDRPADGRDHDPAVLRRARLRHADQPAGSSKGRSTAASRRASAARCTSGWPTTRPASCRTRRSWTS